MRIGNRFGGAVFWSMVALISASWALGADGVERVQPVPLGGSLAELTGDRHFGVYIPTRFGGELTIRVTSGTVGPIIGPDGKERPNGQELGLNQPADQDQHGWYTFTVTETKEPYALETTFVQVGQSTKKPWNFYYWPTKADAIHEPWAGGNGRVDTMQAFGDDVLVATPGGYIPPGQDIVRAGPNGLLESPVAAGDDSTWFPNLYDDLTFRGADGTLFATPSPMLKYDQIFGSSARNWEAANSQNQDIQRWPGHCLGGAVASILLNEPIPAPGSGMTKDEIKALWAELGENHYNHRIGDYANEIPAGPPRPGYDECDHAAPKFHSMLERHIRGARITLLGNLRAFPRAARRTRSGITESTSTPPSSSRSPARAPARSACRSRSWPTRGRASTVRMTSLVLSPTSTRWSMISTAWWTRPIPGPLIGSRLEARRCSAH